MDELQSLKAQLNNLLLRVSEIDLGKELLSLV